MGYFGLQSATMRVENEDFVLDELDLEESGWQRGELSSGGYYYFGDNVVIPLVARTANRVLFRKLVDKYNREGAAAAYGCATDSLKQVPCRNVRYMNGRLTDGHVRLCKFLDVDINCLFPPVLPDLFDHALSEAQKQFNSKSPIPREKYYKCRGCGMYYGKKPDSSEKYRPLFFGYLIDDPCR